MKIALFVAVFFLPPDAARAASIDPPVIAACLDTGNASMWTVIQAQTIAKSIYAGIGVDLEWRHGNQYCKASAKAIIHVEFTTGLRETKYPGALASTRLGDAPHRIDVYYDRVEQLTEPHLVPIVLGHVLAHEIAHVVEGVNRHSAEGVMKANWYSKDYSDMATQPLTFTPEDVALIRGKLEGGPLILAQDRKP